MANATAADAWIRMADTHGNGLSTYPLTSPATGEVIAHIPNFGAEEAIAAAKRAKESFEIWRDKNVHERCRALMRWHEAIQSNTESLAVLTSLEMGKPVSEARGEVMATLEAIEWAAHEAPRVWGEVLPSRSVNRHAYTLRQPVGVVYGITPWNFPLAMVARKAAPALAAGCTVLLKPSEQTPLTAMALSKLWADAGLDPYAFQVLPTFEPSEFTEAVLSNEAVRKITFTGSTTVGRELYRKASNGLRRISLELGGHAPFIVFGDANLELAAQAVIATKFRNAGQTCVSTNRVYIHKSVSPSFTDRLLAKVSELKGGNPLQEDVSIGPVVNQQASRRIAEQIADATSRGASVIAGGKIANLHIEPTVLSGITDTESRVLREETFGPLLPIIEFSEQKEVIQLANGTPYGLAAYIWTESLSKAHSTAAQLDFGLIGVNSLSTIETQAPFGGLKESGIGYEGGKWGIESFLDTKFVNAYYGESQL